MLHRSVLCFAVCTAACAAAFSASAQVSCLVQTLKASDGQEGDRFGSGLAIDGDVAAIGARVGDDAVANCGIVYIFVREKDGRWAEAARISAPDAATADLFGASVALEGDVLAIGAARDDDAGIDTGSVYIYRRGASEHEWLLESKVLAPDGMVDNFGSALAISEGRIAVGTLLGWSTSGRAFLIESDGNNDWSVTAQFTSPFQDPDDAYGIQVDIDGPWLVVGAPGLGEGLNWHGAACVYRHDTASGNWPLYTTLYPSEPTDLGFGASVSASGSRLAIGGGAESASGWPVLAASFFRLQPDNLTWVPDGRFLHEGASSLLSPIPWTDLDGDLFACGGRWPWGDSFGRTKVLARVADGEWDQVGDHLPVEHGYYRHFEQGLGSRVAVDGSTILAADQMGTVAAPDTLAGCIYVYELVDVCELLQGDVNQDAAVDIGDLTFVIETWGACPSQPFLCLSDIAPPATGDGEVNVNDLLLVITNWGR